MEGEDYKALIRQVLGQITYRALEESVHKFLKHMEGRKRWTDYLADITRIQLEGIGSPGKVALIEINSSGEVGGHLIGELAPKMGVAWVHQWYSSTNDKKVADRLFDEFVNLVGGEGIDRIQGFSIRKGIRRRLRMKSIGTVWELRL